MQKRLFHLLEQLKAGQALDRQDALDIIDLGEDQLHTLLFVATEIRQHFCGSGVKTCSIVNAKSGRCREDCRFCAQSAHYDTSIDNYPLMSREQILNKALQEEQYSRRFGIVTAGKGLAKNEVQLVQEAIAGFQEEGLTQAPCASLGILEEKDFLALKKAGLTRYHHNLETSKKFYNNICTTHTYDERVHTIKAAKKAGLELCVGGIFGVGESIEDRIDLLYEIKELDPESVPLNFLVPVKGTPLENLAPISLYEAIKIIAVARLIMPEKVVMLGAGRLEVFQDAQTLIFLAGANGMIVGNLLTVKGRNPSNDLNLIKSMGMKIES